MVNWSIFEPIPYTIIGHQGEFPQRKFQSSSLHTLIDLHNCTFHILSSLFSLIYTLYGRPPRDTNYSRLLSSLKATILSSLPLFLINSNSATFPLIFVLVFLFHNSHKHHSTIFLFNPSQTPWLATTIITVHHPFDFLWFSSPSPSS